MQTFLSNLSQPLAHVVHIGAGTGEAVPVWQAAGARMITLIEGDPGIAEQLETQVGAHEGVRVVQAVVSGDLRERAFRRMNFPDLNSLRAPTGLKQLFPGLKTLSKDLVQPVDPASLVAPLGLSDTGIEAGTNLLLIEAPGEALGILKALAAADLLLHFDRVQLIEARESLYNKAPPAADIAAYLVEAGFSAAFADDSPDPEQPWLIARLDRAALAQSRRFEAMSAKLAQAEADNAALSGDLERVTEAAEVQRAAGEAAQQQAGEVASELASELASARAAAVAEVEGVRAELAGVREQLAGAQAETAQVAEQLAGAQAETAQVAEQLAGAQAETVQVAEQLVGARAEAVQVAEQLVGAQAEAVQVAEQLVGAQAETAQVAEQLAGARAEAVQVAEQLAGAQAETAQVAEQLADAQREAGQRAEQVAVLRVAREEMGLEMAAVKAELEQARRQATGAQAGQQAQLNGQIEALNSQLAAVQAELAQSAEQVTGLRVAREDVAQEMQRLRAEQAKAVEKVTGQAAEVAAGQAAQAAQIAVLESALKEALADGEQASERAKEADKAASKAAEQRLGQARDEMLKAEGQINLIRDLLLHGAHL